MEVQVDHLPALGLSGFQVDEHVADGLCTVLAASGAYVIDTQSPPCGRNCSTSLIPSATPKRICNVGVLKGGALCMLRTLGSA